MLRNGINNPVCLDFLKYFILKGSIWTAKELFEDCIKSEQLNEAMEYNSFLTEPETDSRFMKLLFDQNIPFVQNDLPSLALTYSEDFIDKYSLSIWLSIFEESKELRSEYFLNFCKHTTKLDPEDSDDLIDRIITLILSDDWHYGSEYGFITWLLALDDSAISATIIEQINCQAIPGLN